MIRFLARHPTAANLLMLLLLAMGILTISELRRETMPDFSASELQIRVAYPGATATEVEEVICQRIEDALDGVSYVAEMLAEARENVGVVTVEMEEGADFGKFQDDVETEIDAIDDFPDDVEDPVIEKLGQKDLVLALLVSGSLTPGDLKVFCEQLKDKLQLLDEVSLVDVLGFSQRQLRVELSAEALQRYGMSAAQVADTIARQSVDLPTGAIETRDREVLIRFVEQRRTASELEDLIILEGTQGSQVHLSDLGRVVDAFEFDEDKITMRGRRAGVLHIKKTKTQDSVRIANAVKAFLEEERQRLPPGVEILVTQDSSTLVVDRLQMLVKNGWQGILLVFFCMWLFFSLRFSFWVAMGLPVSFLGAFFFLPLIGLTINMLTMVGLLLALGLLMDDAIVIAENVASHLRRGKSAMQAAIDGTNEVKIGVFSSFITTVCIFAPLTVIEGDIGKVLRVVPMILILVLAVSLVEAFCILPAHLGHALHGHEKDQVGAFRRWFDDRIDWLRERVVGRLVDTLVEWRYLTVGCVIMALLLSVGMMVGGILKFQAFPDLEGDTLVARILLPQGTPLARTDAIVTRVTKGLDVVDQKFSPGQPDGNKIIRSVYTMYNSNSDAFEQGPHVATVYVELLGADIRKGARIDDILQAWRTAVGEPADVLSLVFTEPVFGPAGRPIEIRLAHIDQDLDRLKAAATAVRDWLSSYVGVYNLADDLRPGKLEARIRLREGAYGLGFDGRDVANQLRAAFQGVTADEIQVGTESFEIDVRLGDGDTDSVADLEQFYLSLADGKQVPLGAVAIVEAGSGWARIARVDGRRTVTVRGDVDTRLTNTTALLRLFRKEAMPELLERHPGLQISLEGEIKEGAKTQGSMLSGMLVGVLGIFLLLSFQFRSYIEPFIVLTAIPCAFIGVVIGHLLLGHDLSMPSMLGLVSLAGVVVNDSILLVEFIKKHRRAGQDLHTAAALASRERFRAVLLTSLTTVAGLTPLLAERSLQAQLLIPLAISIVFGIITSTLLILFVIPCSYGILGDLGLVTEEGPTDDLSPDYS